MIWRGHGRCSTRQEASTGSSISRPARPVCSRAWRGGRSPPATRDAAVFAADAAEGASASGDPATQLLADTAVAAVTAITQPTRHNAEVFVALAQQRAQGRAYRSLSPMSQMWPRSRPAWRCPLTERPGLAETAVAAGRFAAFLRAPAA